MKRIMIVDDEPLTRYALRKLISTHFSEHEVIEEVDNGIDAVDRALALQPDIIFMDIKMPGQSGIEASEQILEEYPKIHIIILTAYDHFNYIQKALEIGVEGYLLKPISKEVVIKKIHDILKRIQLIEDKENARKTLQNNLDSVIQLAEKDFLHQLTQNEYNETLIKKYLTFFGYKISYGYFMFLSFDETDNLFYNSSIVRERTRIKIESAINRYLPFMTNYILGSPRGNCIVLFVYEVESTAHNQHSESQMIANHLKHKISIVENIQIKIGIGRAYQNVNRYKESFYEAYSALRVIGQGEVKHIEDLEDWELDNDFKYPIKVIDELKEKIFLGTIDEALKLSDIIINDISLSNLPIPYLKEYLIQFYYDIRHIFVERNILIVEEDSDFILPFKQTVLIEELMNIIKMQMDRMIRLGCKTFSQGNQTLTAKIYDYIHSRYKENITLEDVAEEISKTSQYTSKIFKELFGINFVEYLSQIKIDHAKVLLKETPMHIKEVAMDIGYEDANYFCRIFKKKTGMTPKEFRELG